MKTNKIIALFVIASVIGLVGWFIPVAKKTGNGTVTTTLGSQVQNDVFQFAQGIVYGFNTYPGVGSVGGTGGISENRVPLYLAPGQNQTAWCNTTGSLVFADSFQGVLTATSTYLGTSTTLVTPVASTTLALFVGTSTQSSIIAGTSSTNVGNPTYFKDGASPVFGSLVSNFLIATGTTNAVAIASDQIQTVSITSSATVMSSTNQGFIPVYSGQCLVEALENPYSQTQGFSELATSTNRGYNFYGSVLLNQ